MVRIFLTRTISTTIQVSCLPESRYWWQVLSFASFLHSFVVSIALRVFSIRKCLFRSTVLQNSAICLTFSGAMTLKICSPMMSRRSLQDALIHFLSIEMSSCHQSRHQSVEKIQNVVHYSIQSGAVDNFSRLTSFASRTDFSKVSRAYFGNLCTSNTPCLDDTYRKRRGKENPGPST